MESYSLDSSAVVSSTLYNRVSQTLENKPIPVCQKISEDHLPNSVAKNQNVTKKLASGRTRLLFSDVTGL